MPGETTTGSLSGALDTIIADARVIKEMEHPGSWERTCDVRRFKKGAGVDWIQYMLNKISASDITETTRNENFQTFSGTLLTITPAMSQIAVKITDRTYRRLASIVIDKMGTAAGRAMERKKDEDYLDLFSTFATGASPGTGNPLASGHIGAAVSRIQSNTTEPSSAVINSILHGYHIKDVADELIAGLGTYTVPVGLTEEVFRRGFAGTVAGSNVLRNDHIAIDSTPDAKSATHAKEGVLAIIGMEIKKETRRDPSYGGGADEIFLTDEYGFGEALSGTTQVWAYLHQADATAPTS